MSFSQAYCIKCMIFDQCPVIVILVYTIIDNVFDTFCLWTILKWHFRIKFNNHNKCIKSLLKCFLIIIIYGGLKFRKVFLLNRIYKCMNYTIMSYCPLNCENNAFCCYFLSIHIIFIYSLKMCCVLLLYCYIHQNFVILHPRWYIIQ